MEAAEPSGANGNNSVYGMGEEVAKTVNEIFL